jgi:hypothetical protein
MERKMNNKLKLLLVTGLMAAGMGVACAHVQFKLNPNIKFAQGDYSMGYFFINQADDVNQADDSVTNAPAMYTQKMSAIDVARINSAVWPYTDSFSYKSAGSTSNSDMHLNFSTTSGAEHCTFNAAQLLKASMSNQTITLPNPVYCTPG